jgi:hypothetical protein
MLAFLIFIIFLIDSLIFIFILIFVIIMHTFLFIRLIMRYSTLI